MKDNVPDDYSVLIFKRIYLIQIADCERQNCKRWLNEKLEA